eukprot:1536294-Amphidinium_carterae.1
MTGGEIAMPLDGPNRRVVILATLIAHGYHHGLRVCLVTFEPGDASGFTGVWFHWCSVLVGHVRCTGYAYRVWSSEGKGKFNYPNLKFPVMLGGTLPDSLMSLVQPCIVDVAENSPLRGEAVARGVPHARSWTAGS